MTRAQPVAKPTLKDVSEDFVEETEMQDCIDECLESPVQLEEMDFRLEKKIDILW